MQLGDKVWRGYLSAIAPSQSSVEFTVNEGGVVRKIVKKIQFDRRRRKL